MKKDKTSEADIAKTVIKYLQHENWSVYQEVQFATGGKIADIVAVRHNHIWIIETKTSLTLRVMDQARYWRVPFRSIAIPYAGTSSSRDERRIAYDIAQNYLKIGVMEVNREDIKEPVRPPIMREYFRSQKYEKMLSMLDGFPPEYKAAGSNGGGYFTPYKSTIRAARAYITSNPGCTTNDMMAALGRGHYSSLSSARSNLPKCLVDFESDWCLVVRDDQQRFHYYIKG